MEEKISDLQRLKNELEQLRNPRKNNLIQKDTTLPQRSEAETEKNKGGFVGGVGYTAEKLGLGVLRSLEGISDFVVGGIADLFGGDEFAENLMKNDWVNYSHADEWYDPGKGWQFVGDVAGGVGNMLPSIIITAATAGAAAPVALAGSIASTGQFIGSAMGQSVSEATKETGSLGGKEWLYGTASGALEGGIEAISGGIGGTQVGKVLGKQLGKSTLGKIGMTVAGEGLEEVASDIANPLLKRATGVDENAKVDWKELPRTFAVGGVTGAVMGGGKRVLDAAKVGGFNNLNAAETTQELTDRQADNNIRQLKGKTATYTQEDIARTKENLSKRLQKMDGTTRAQFLQANANIANQFNEDGTVKSVAPAPDTYNTNAYSASLQGREGTFAYKPISESSKTTVQAKQVMDTLTKITDGKTNIVLTEDALATESGGTANGLYKDGIIYLNANATDYQKALTVGVHEVIHGLEGTKEYEQLAKAITEEIKNDPDLAQQYNIDKYRAAYDSILEGEWTETTKDYQAVTEIFADFLANKVANNEQLLRNLSVRNSNVVVRFLNWVRNSIAKLGESAEERAIRKDLKKLERMLVKALEAGTGGISLERVEELSKSAEKRLKTQDGNIQSVKFSENKNADGKIATARAQLGVDKSKFGNYNKKKFSFQHKNFPGEQISGSEAHRLAVWWASKKSVNVGDQTLISMRDRWYIVEKFASADNHYQVEDRITKAEFETIFKEIKQYGRSGQIKSVSWGIDEVNKLDKQRSSIKRREPSVDSNKTQYGRQNSRVQQLAENEVEGRERTSSNGRGNSKSSGQNRQGRASLDVEYDNAIKDGDTALAQRMVDKAAKEAGYDKKRFHETKEENIIHVFNLDLNTNASADYGTPFGVFTKSHNRSVGLGGKQMSLYVKADRTFSVKDRTETPKRLPQEYSTFVDKINAIDAEYDAKYEQLSDDLLDSFAEWLDDNDTNDKMRNAWDVSKNLEEQFGDALPKELIEKERKFLKVRDEWTNKTNQAILDAKKWLTKWLRDNGYDSMELEFDNGAGNRVTDALIVLDKEQVKSAEPATYDDNGNLIPLSKRFNKKKADIRYSLPINIEADVKKYYGSTYRWNETGYILQDGTRLDLSGRNEGSGGGYRQVDHRDIFGILEDGPYGTEAMVEFMGRGNIRVIPETPGINLQVEPNAEQYRLIQDFVERVGWKEGYFSVDIDNKNGDTIETLTYEGKPSGRKVVADLKYYFKEGKVPYKSNLSAFRYSIDVDADIADFPSIDKWFDSLTAEELRELIDNDYTVEDISEELNVDTKKMRYLIRREGLGDSYVEDSKKAVMKQSRIDEAIDDSGASNPTYARDYITAISPKDFIDLTVRTDHVDRKSFDREVIGDHGGVMGEWDYEKALQTSRSPYLQIDKATGRVIGHNGRHRIRALEKAGIESVEIQVEFFDEDGRLIKYNAETIPKMAISSQFDTDIETTISKIIPLNESHRTEIEATYGEKANPKAGVRYALDAELDKKTTERVQTVVSDEKLTLKERWENTVEKLKEGRLDQWMKAQIACTDEQAGILLAGRNIGVVLHGEVQRARSAKASATNMLTNEQRDFSGKNRVGDSLKSIFQPIQSRGEKVAQAFNLYLLHQLNVDRMEAVEKGLSQEYKYVFEEKVDKGFSLEKIKELESKYPEFKKTAEKVWQYNQNLLQYRVDAGLITQEQADQMTQMYPHYVPAFYEKNGGSGTSGASVGNKGIAVRTGIKKAKGSTGVSDIKDVPTSIAKQTVAVVRAASINNVVSKLYDGAVAKNDFTDIEEVGREKVANPDVDYDKEIPKVNQVYFYKDGERITLDVTDYVYAGFQGLTAQAQLSDPLTSVSAKLISLFKKSVTSWNLLFAATNAIRDAQEALFYTKYGAFKLMGNYGKSLFMRKHDPKLKELWQQYVAMGGTGSGYFSNDTGVYDARNKVKKGLAAAMEKFTWLNEWIEQTPRFAEFVASVEAGNSVEQALYDSAEVTTNFSRGGTVAKKLNRTLIPFLNPSIQGWSKLWRSWVAPMDGKSAAEIEKLSKQSKGRQILSKWGVLIVKSVAVGIAVGLFNDMLYRWIDEDEDYANLPLNIKENYYLLKVGGKFIKIPKGRVIALYGSVATRISEAANGNEEALDAWSWYKSASEMVSPLESASRTIFAPFYDVATNTTWYGGQIESASMENLAQGERYDEGTSSIAIAIGKAINYSPKKIHYLIDQYSGVIGDLILPATTNKAEKDMLSSRFMVDPVYNNDISTKYYNYKDELTYAKNSGDVNAKLMLKYMNEAQDDLTEMYQKKRDIANDKSLSDKEKAAQTSAIQSLINGTLSSSIDAADEFEQLIINSGFEQAVALLEGSSEYQRMEQNVRSSAYNRMVDYYYEVCLSALTNKKLETKYVLYGALNAPDLMIYLTDINNIESDKDKKGNTIQGSRKEKVQKYIQGLKITVQQKYILSYLAGYAPTNNGKSAISKYLKNNGYTQKEVNDLWN